MIRAFSTAQKQSPVPKSTNAYCIVSCGIFMACGFGILQYKKTHGKWAIKPAEPKK